jgi:peptidoglycan/xylan/chitin deacetylase (PgdA/CDA1 family)
MISCKPEALASVKRNIVSTLPHPLITVFRNDDLSALSDVEHERRVAEVFDRHGVLQTLGVVPKTCPLSEYHQPKGALAFPLSTSRAMVEFVRQYAERSGSEIAMHGYTHRPNRMSIPARREYKEFRGLPFEEQRQMIAAGLGEIESALGVRPRTFIPPWDRLDEATVQACRANGLSIISSGPYMPALDGVVPVGSNCDIFSFPQLLDGVSTFNTTGLLVVCYHSHKIRTSEDFAALERAVRLAAETPQCQVLTVAGAAAHGELASMANAAAMNAVGQSEVLATNRARAVLYQRCLGVTGRPTRLEVLLARARCAYQEGRYADAVALSPDIDRSTKRLLNCARSALGVLAWIAGVLATLASVRFPAATRLWIVAMPVMMAGVLGGLAWWRATAHDTRRELAHGMVIALTCAALGAATVVMLRTLTS